MRQITISCMALAMLVLTACGGGGGGGSGSSSGGTTVSGPPVNSAQASRFLMQASFGPTSNAIAALTTSSVEAWIEDQFTQPQTSHQATVDAILAARLADADTTNDSLSQDDFFQSFWTQAARGDDQLRQRTAFALSQIFVVSFDGALSGEVRGIAAYYDMLGRDAFGNFRTLLEDVSRSPMMGVYLSHLKNQKEDPKTGRTPDENYAREVMQLFTIGLYQLNTDGTPKTSGGKPLETYTNADITGLAKVFTGFSYGGPDKSDQRFWDYSSVRDPNSRVIPMQGYPKFHSISAKTFLGTTIAASTSADPDGDLKIALDTLFNHPNVGPFIGRQLIQRLVTSNPSPAYVARVAAAFNDNGKGVRGDMKAVIRAVLLDDEARDRVGTYATNASYGKLREPVLRLANWMRAFAATSSSGNFRVGNTDSTNALGMSPMRSSSVFNFYRPGYTAPDSNSGAAGLVAPELQITYETSVAGYLNYMQSVVPNGVGQTTADKAIAPYTAELALADTPAALVDRINLLLYANAMRATTRQTIIDAVSAIAISTTNQTAAATARLNRVRLAVFLGLASPEYLVQK